MSDSILLSTGYATITREIMKRLAKEYDITHFGWQFVGNPLNFYPEEECVSYGEKKGRIKLLPNPGNHPFGANMLQNYIRMEMPDMFWCLCDSFMLFDWIQGIDFAPAKSLFYFPSDGEYFPFGCDTVLKKFQHVVAMSRFAQAQVKRLYNIDVDYIPHGIDTNFFTPVDEKTKRQLREKWSQRLQTDLVDKFIISSVGRNQGRKALPEFLKVLGKFVKGKEKDVRIILHCLKSDMPIIIKKDKLIDIIPIRDIIEWNNDQNIEVQEINDLEIFDGNGFTKIKKVQRRLSEDKIIRINTFNGLIDVTEDHLLFEENAFNFKKANEFKENDILLTSSFNEKNELNFSEDFAWLLGFFVAEGSAGKYKDKKKNSYYWEFHIDNKKKEYLDICSWTLKKYFNCEVYINKNKDNVYRLTTNKNNIITPLFLDYCYTKSNHKKNLYKEKRIPKIILNSNNPVQLSFFDGYYCGDGIQNENKQYYGFTTNSKTLAMGLIYLIRRLDFGIINIFSEERISKNGKYNSYYKVFISNTTSEKTRNKIKKIKELPYNKEWVYDIETESHKYATGVGDIIVHNCDPEDPAGIGPPQWLFGLIQRYGLEHVVRFSGTKVWFQFPFNDYREMYQIADIHALATTGEGFGIPTMESQSCGLPNVITNYTTSKELVEEPGTGLTVPIGYELTGTWAVERGFVDKEKMFEALETIYKDESLRKEMGKKARENALNYDWNTKVFPMWSRKIKEILEE